MVHYKNIWLAWLSKFFCCPKKAHNEPSLFNFQEAITLSGCHWRTCSLLWYKLYESGKHIPHMGGLYTWLRHRFFPITLNAKFQKQSLPGFWHLLISTQLKDHFLLTYKKYSVGFAHYSRFYICMHFSVADIYEFFFRILHVKGRPKCWHLLIS